VKILQLAQFLPPMPGGEERHVWTLATALAARGHQVTLLGFAAGGEGPGEITSEGVRVVRVRTAASRLSSIYTDTAVPHAPPVPDPVVIRAIHRELARSGFDVIHAHNWIVNSALGPAARAGVPVVMTLHDYSHFCATKRLMEHGKSTICAGPSARRCLSCASAHYGAIRGPITVAANAWTARRRFEGVSRFLSVSGAVATAVGDNAPLLRGATLSSEVVTNFIPDDIVLDQIPVPDRDAPLLYVGTLVGVKGVQVLLDAYETLGGPPPLLLAGPAAPGTEWRFPEGAHWLGQTPRDELLDLYRTACAVIVPSVWSDPCPTVVLEAMAAGRPVIGASSGGIVDMVVDGVTGILVPPGDVSALAQAITALLIDPEAAEQMGYAGRNRAREFTVTAVVERIERVYASAIAEATSR
jgi:glycogen synthase